MKFVTHMFTLGDTIHGIIRKTNKRNMTKEQVLELKGHFNEKNGQRVPVVGETFEIPQWEEHEIPAEPTPEVVEVVAEPVVEETEGKIIVVKTKEEGDMLLRQERRENARRERRGKRARPLSVIHVTEEVEVVTTNSPPPRTAPEIVNTSGLPARELNEEEQVVLRRALLSSVEIIDEGELVEPEPEPAPEPAPVEKPVEVEDTVPAAPSREEQIAEKRRLARERRQKQLQQKK